MGLKKVAEQLKKALVDMSSLHVQTYTGTLDFETDTKTGEKPAFDTVREAVAKGKTESRITLVAESYYQFDGDSYNFISSAVVSEKALAMHTAAVQAGLATRQGIVDFVKDRLD